jgi:hypothetical protein
MNAPARSSTIDPLLHPRDVARILNVSTSWLAKSRLSGDGPRFVKIGRAVRYLEASTSRRGREDRPASNKPILACQGRERSRKINRAPKLLL